MGQPYSNHACPPGRVDDVRIYDRALSAGEVQALAKGTLGVKDLDGNVLDGEYSGSLPSGEGTAGGDFAMSFTITGDAPTVTGTFPPNASTAVSVFSTVEITFSEPMDHASVESAFSCDGGVTGSFSWSGQTLVFLPSTQLGDDTTYTVTVASSAMDWDGMQVSSDYGFSFTTSDALSGGEPLPAGYVSRMLHLGTTEADRITNASDGIDYFLQAGLGPEYEQRPSPGTAVVLSPATTTQTPMVWTDLTDGDADGMWCENVADNYVMYWAIYVSAPSTRLARLYVSHDDDSKGWMDGESTPIYSLPYWGEGCSSTFTLSAGRIHRFIFKLGDTGGSDHLAVRFESPDGGAMSDLRYMLTADVLPPDVVSIMRAGTSPTSATSVDFTVTFDQDVTGVDELDFDVTVTDSASGNVATVLGSGSVYTVTVGSVSGTGTLRLDLVDNDSIIDVNGNPLAGAADGSFASGEAYAIDNDAPYVVSITLAGADPTNASTVSFTVTFSEVVTGFGQEADLEIVCSGTTGGLFSITPVSPSVYTVAVSVSGDGTLGLNVVDDNSIIDGAGHTLGGPLAGDGDAEGPFYTVDNIPPDPPSVDGPATPTTNAQPTWTWLAGSNGVGQFRYGFTEGDWIANDVPDLSYTPPAPLADGTWTLLVQERDEMGNWSASGSYAVTIDATPPADPTLALTDQTSGSPTFTNSQTVNAAIESDADAVAWLVSETQAMQPSEGDPAWTPVEPTAFTFATGTEELKTVYVWTKDAAGNVSANAGSATITLDTTPPSVTVNTRTTSDATPALSGTVNDPSATIRVTVGGDTYAATNAGATWTVGDDVIWPELAVGTYDVGVAATDAAGNVGTDATVNELVITAPAKEDEGCAAGGGTGGGSRFALLLPLALALATLRRRARGKRAIA